MKNVDSRVQVLELAALLYSRVRNRVLVDTDFDNLDSESRQAWKDAAQAIVDAGWTKNA